MSAWMANFRLLDAIRRASERLLPPLVVEDLQATPGTVLLIDPSELGLPGDGRRRVIVHPDDAPRIREAIEAIERATR